MAPGVIARAGPDIDATGRVHRTVTWRPSPYRIGRIIDTTRATSLGVHIPAACPTVGGLPAPTMPERLLDR